MPVNSQPSALFLGNAVQGPKGLIKAQEKALKSLPPQFSTKNLVEAQFEAISKDGTKVPYFIVYNDAEGTCIHCNAVIFLFNYCEDSSVLSSVIFQ